MGKGASRADKHPADRRGPELQFRRDLQRGFLTCESWWSRTAPRPSWVFCHPSFRVVKSRRDPCPRTRMADCHAPECTGRRAPSVPAPRCPVCRASSQPSSGSPALPRAGPDACVYFMHRGSGRLGDDLGIAQLVKDLLIFLSITHLVKTSKGLEIEE